MDSPRTLCTNDPCHERYDHCGFLVELDDERRKVGKLVMEVSGSDMFVFGAPFGNFKSKTMAEGKFRNEKTMGIVLLII
jgi:hypothetical protein